MRKSLALLLALLLVVTICVCACKKDEAPAESDSATVSDSTPAGEETTTEETDAPKAALKPIAKDDNNVVDGDWTKRY